MITTARIQKFLPAIIIALSTFFSIGYSSGPIFEAPDEIQHYFYIKYLVDSKKLPDVYNLPDNHLSVEMFEPPLYYALAVPIKLLIADPDFRDISAGDRQNIGQPKLSRLFGSQPPPPLGNDNKNYYLHSRREDFPYTASGTALAAHLIRLYSVALGVITLLAAASIFRLLWPDHPARQWMALGVAAFWPLRTFMAGAINNDNLVGLMSTLSIYLILRQITVGPSLRHALLLGGTLGGALLAKENGLLLFAPFGAALALDWKRQRHVIAAMFVAVIVVAGWWFLRNWLYYGDVTSFRNQPMYIDTGGAIGSGVIKFSSLPDRLLLVYQRFWASFNDGGVVPVGPQLDILYSALTILGLVGAIVGLIVWTIRSRGHEGNRTRWMQIAVLASYSVAIVGGLAYIVLINVFATQPRFLIPGASIVGALLAFGWDSLTPGRLKLRVALSSVMLWAAMACYALAAYFLPVYRPLPAPSHIEHPLHVNFEGKLTLVGTAQETVSAWPGDTVSITLYWQAGEPTDHMKYVLLLRTTNANLWAKLTYPGNGHLLANEWSPGQRWAERYQFKLPSDAIPGTYGIAVSFEQFDPLHLLAARWPDGSLDTAPVVIQLVIL